VYHRREGGGGAQRIQKEHALREKEAVGFMLEDHSHGTASKKVLDQLTFQIAKWVGTEKGKGRRESLVAGCGYKFAGEQCWGGRKGEGMPRAF